MSEHIVWALVLLPATTALFTLLNVLTWRRGRAAGAARRSFSVLIPARDEAANIEACVRAALATEALEVLVYDDGSTDATPEILARVAAEDPRLRVLSGRPLPEGWLGKPHACHRLAEAARGERLLFVDADVQLSLTSLPRLESVFEAVGAKVISAMPRQRMGTFAERLLMPVLRLTYTSWFWLELVHRSRDVRFLAAIGQVLAVDRDAYFDGGGFARVRDQVVDDMAFCRMMKASGRKVAFIDGFRVAECRMYVGFREIWGGFTKNLYPGLGARPSALFLVLGLYLAAFVLPWVALGAGLSLAPALVAPAAVGVALNVFTRAALVVRYAHPLESLVLQPFAALGFCAIAIGSWRRTTRGRVTWRGRAVPVRAPRDARAAEISEVTS